MVPIMMNNLAVIDTKTHEVGVFLGRRKVARAQFNVALEPDQVEQMRIDPEGFLALVNGMTEEPPQAA